MKRTHPCIKYIYLITKTLGMTDLACEQCLGCHCFMPFIPTRIVKVLALDPIHFRCGMRN